MPGVPGLSGSLVLQVQGTSFARGPWVVKKARVSLVTRALVGWQFRVPSVGGRHRLIRFSVREGALVSRAA